MTLAEKVNPERPPSETLITTVTVAELAAGPYATDDDMERARRQERLLWAAATWEPLPFDADAARAYGTIFAAVRSAGRQAHPRLADLLIAALAASRAFALYSRNPSDFRFPGARGRRPHRPGLNARSEASVAGPGMRRPEFGPLG